jgi:Peptidase M15
VDLAHVVQLLEQQYDVKVKITSAYRTPAYNRCIIDLPTSRHLEFAAIDLRLTDSNGESETPSSRLVAALEEIRSDGKFDLTFTPIENSVHVELTGARKRLVSRPRVYLQFVGGSRTAAQELSRRLSERGFFVLVEDQERRATGEREVRYFYEEDKLAADVLKESAAAALGDMGFLEEPVRTVDLTGFGITKRDKGVLELSISVGARGAGIVVDRI